MKRILITGANGLLGQTLLATLTDHNQYEIHATGRGNQRFSLPVFAYYDCDLADFNALNQLFDTVKPDLVIHAAALTQVDFCEENREEARKVNALSTRALVRLCEKHNVYLQYISTDFVFDGEAGLYIESDQPNPVNYYGVTKWEAERYVMASSLRWSIVRTVLVYGQVPNMSRSNIVLWVKSSLEKEQQIKVVGDQWRTPTLVNDLADGCLLILEAEGQGIFHVSGDEYMSPYQLAVRVARHFDLDEELIQEVNQSTFVEKGRRPLKTGFDVSKMKMDFGFKPHSLEDGLDLMFAYRKPD